MTPPHAPSTSSAPARRYVALGDSYTIGTAVERAERFPDQLVAALRNGPSPLELVANLGVNGYTSAEVIRQELPALDALEPSFVSILIGVNDAVQGVPLAVYERNVSTILDDLLRRLPARAIVTVSTPDYTVTPAGADFGEPSVRRAAIRAANDAAAPPGPGTVDRLRGYPRPVAPCGGGSLPRRERWPPPEWRAVRAVGRAPCPGRRGPPGRLIVGSAATAGAQLVEPRVADPEVMRDLVVDRLGDGCLEPFRRPVRADERPAEDRDLARDRGAVGPEVACAGCPGTGRTGHARGPTPAARRSPRPRR